MRRAGHVARVEQGDDIYGRLTLKGMFKWWDVTWAGLMWLGIGRGGGLL
jgi:hypothetical protein